VSRLRELTRFHPTRRLAAAAALVAPLWLLSDTRSGWLLALAAIAVIVIAVFADLALLPAQSNIDVMRDAGATLGAGDEGAGEYVIHSRWQSQLRIELHDRLPPAVERRDSSERVHNLDGGESVTIPLLLAGRVRGRHILGDVALRVTTRIGLIARILHYRLDDSILVTPSLAGVRNYRLLALQHRLRDVGIRSLRRRGEGTSFSSLREYAPGDDPRHVDWKASARRGTLVSREFAIEQGQSIMILIDAGRLMTQQAGTLPRFEYALSSALTVADVAVSGNDRVGVMVFDDEVRAFVPPTRGPAALRMIRDALIPATARLVEPDYAAAFRTLAARHRKRSLLILFTDVIDRRSSAALIAHTSRSAARHLPLVVALRNEQLTRAAVPAATATDATLFEAAAAEEMLGAREEALQGMRQAGVVVLDVAPSAMTPAVINRYLELKGRSSI
jgi:uncharacterized protein (DUF58 family)